MEETLRLYRQILDAELPADAVGDKVEPAGPWIPLAGRQQELALLRREWEDVRQGTFKLTLLGGPGGAGKTRLVRSFLHEVTSSARVTVLQGRCFDLSPRQAFAPFTEALRNAIAHEVEVTEEVLETIDLGTLAVLAQLVPELRGLRPDLPLAEELPPAAARERLFSAIAQLLHRIVDGTAGRGGKRPVILFADNVHWADGSGFELLATLRRKLAEQPVWIIAAYRSTETPPDPPLADLLAEAEAGGILELRLDPLEPADVEQIATALLGESEAQELATFLRRKSEGTPLLVAEWINLLWDEGVLVPQPSGRWRLSGLASSQVLQETADFAAMIQRRLSFLPTSTRRLLTLAAVIGQRFEAELLEAAENEHSVVIETGIGVMLERWLVRLDLPYWADSRHERDIALWASGPGHGAYEFAHQSIRGAVYSQLNPLRTQVLHRQVAVGLERHAADLDAACEALAYHYALARTWRPALRFAERAAAKAERIGATETARYYYQQALEAAAELERESGEDEQLEERKQKWRQALEALGPPAMLQPVAGSTAARHSRATRAES